MINFSLFQSLPMYRQSEVAECGLACLAMISSYYGNKVDLPYLRQNSGATIKGMSLSDIVNIADTLSLSGRALQCPIENLEALQLPAILHWDMNHFVVLKKVTSKGLVIHDPARGVRTVLSKEVDLNYTGVALELTPKEDFQKSDHRGKPRLSMLWGKLRDFKRSVAKLLMLSVVVQVVTLLMPYYNQIIIDDVLIANDEDLLLALGIGFGLLVLFEVFARYLRGWLMLRMSTTMGLQIGVNVMSHLLRLPMSFFESRHMGDIYSRFDSINNIRETITRGMSEAIIDGFMTVILIIVMFYYSWELTTCVLAVGGVYLVIRLGFQGHYRKNTENMLVERGKEQSFFMESLKGIQTIKLYNYSEQRLAGWQNRFVDLINTEVSIGRLTLSFEVINKLLFGIENVVIMYFAAMFVMDGDFTLGAMMAFISFKRYFMESFTKLVDNMIEFKLLKLHLERIVDISGSKKEEMGGGTVAKSYNDVDGDIEIENVGFQYDKNSPFLFRGLNLTIRKGESVVFTGASGAGKTTLLKIVMGLLEPTEGRVLYGGHDIRELGLNKYRECIATVMQNDHLFTGSLKDNIALFSESPDIEKVKMAAFRALMHQEIEKMPMGYDSLVGDMGSSLSGGQQQRIMIARALYRDTPLMFMDEATSHLDVENEKRIIAYLKAIKKTRISVAHRLETIEMADRKFVLSNGELTEKA